MGDFNGEHSENPPVWKYPTLNRMVCKIVSFPYKVCSERAYISLHTSYSNRPEYEIQLATCTCLHMLYRLVGKVFFVFFLLNSDN